MAIEAELLVLLKSLVHEGAHVVVLPAVIDLVKRVSVEFVHLVADV